MPQNLRRRGGRLAEASGPPRAAVVAHGCSAPWPADTIPGPSLLPLRAFPPLCRTLVPHPSAVIPHPSALVPPSSSLCLPARGSKRLMIDFAFRPPTLPVRSLPPRTGAAGTELGTYPVDAQEVFVKWINEELFPQCCVRAWEAE